MAIIDRGEVRQRNAIERAQRSPVRTQLGGTGSEISPEDAKIISGMIQSLRDDKFYPLPAGISKKQAKPLWATAFSKHNQEMVISKGGN